MSKKLVVLTGVTRGLGRAMAVEFVRLGHVVLGCGRSRAEIAERAAQFGAPNDFCSVDVSSADEVEAWARRVLASHGAPDLLVNNAAVINRNAPLWKVSARAFE